MKIKLKTFSLIHDIRDRILQAVCQSTEAEHILVFQYNAIYFIKPSLKSAEKYTRISYLRKATISLRKIGLVQETSDIQTLELEILSRISPVFLPGWLGALSTSVSLMISPLTIAICRRKSTRLTAVLGGLVTALACLFTSFANQFHQLFLSYGIMLGEYISNIS